MLLGSNDDTSALILYYYTPSTWDRSSTISEFLRVHSDCYVVDRGDWGSCIVHVGLKCTLTRKV